MKAPLKEVVLVGNYEPDAQQSMLRYTRSLHEALSTQGVAVRTLQPKRIFGAPRNPHHGLAKWLAYVDKFILFPRSLAAEARRAGDGVVFHVTDHSNAPVLGRMRGAATVATCHDMLAILGARGEDPWCPATKSGRRLQDWILAHLRRARGVACDSTHTRRDFERLTQREGDPLVRTILLPMNDAVGGPLSVPARDVLRECLPALGDAPFLLHVGSALPRKNRISVVRVLGTAVRQGWHGHLVLAGEAIEGTLRAEAKRLGVADRLHGASEVTPRVLRALYTSAHALVFPSHGEGFGYPVLEAQACGCPVICSNRTSVPEVAGDAALCRDPLDVEGMATDVLSLRDPALRAGLVARGTGNLGRFTAEGMARACISLYTDVLAAYAGRVHSPER